jgi:hypothetical protein
MRVHAVRIVSDEFFTIANLKSLRLQRNDRRSEGSGLRENADMMVGQSSDIFAPIQAGSGLSMPVTSEFETSIRERLKWGPDHAE